MKPMATLSPVLKQATPVVVDYAAGSWIHATDGKKYLDFTTGIGVTSTGHCHPDVVAAAREQVGKIVHAQYTTVMHKPLLELTEQTRRIPARGDRQRLLRHLRLRSSRSLRPPGADGDRTAQHHLVRRWLPRQDSGCGLADDRRHQVPLRILAPHGWGAHRPLPPRLPVRLG